MMHVVQNLPHLVFALQTGFPFSGISISANTVGTHFEIFCVFQLIVSDECVQASNKIQVRLSQAASGCG